MRVIIGFPGVPEQEDIAPLAQKKTSAKSVPKKGVKHKQNPDATPQKQSDGVVDGVEDDGADIESPSSAEKALKQLSGRRSKDIVHSAGEMWTKFLQGSMNESFFGKKKLCHEKVDCAVDENHS